VVVAGKVARRAPHARQSEPTIPIDDDDAQHNKNASESRNAAAERPAGSHRQSNRRPGAGTHTQTQSGRLDLAGMHQLDGLTEDNENEFVFVREDHLGLAVAIGKCGTLT
jgi:hypothetical protein